jgi:hypothetical protein
MFEMVGVAVFILVAVLVTSGLVAYPLVFLIQLLSHRLPWKS